MCRSRFREPSRRAVPNPRWIAGRRLPAACNQEAAARDNVVCLHARSGPRQTGTGPAPALTLPTTAAAAPSTPESTASIPNDLSCARRRHMFSCSVIRLPFEPEARHLRANFWPRGARWDTCHGFKRAQRQQGRPLGAFRPGFEANGAVCRFRAAQASHGKARKTTVSLQEHRGAGDEQL